MASFTEQPRMNFSSDPGDMFSRYKAYIYLAFARLTDRDLNALVTNGISHPYHLDESIFI